MLDEEFLQTEWFSTYRELREKLSKNDFCLDSETSYEFLKNEYKLNCSIESIKIAVNYLIAEGIIDTIHDKSEKIKSLTRSSRDVGFISDYSDKGRRPKIRSIVLELISRDQINDEVKQYIVNQDELLYIHHYHLQLVDNIPHALADTYIPYSLFKDIFPVLRDSAIDLYVLMEKLGYPVTQKEERLYVDMPTPKEQKFLELLHNKQQQVVRLDCRVWSNSTLVEICILCDRGDLYEFNYNVSMNS